MELLCAKEDGYLPSLSYLDTARGIEPIVAKLSYGLQEKWISDGSRFKVENNGRFPPFDFFARFVCYEAHKRNDPSFSLLSAATPHVKPEKLSFKAARNPIMVHKTDVVSTASNAGGQVGITSDLNKNCPIHSKPHPLKRCRAFRAKSLNDRKTFLKEKGICFRCCRSIAHVAKDCSQMYGM